MSCCFDQYRAIQTRGALFDTAEEERERREEGGRELLKSKLILIGKHLSKVDKLMYCAYPSELYKCSLFIKYCIPLIGGGCEDGRTVLDSSLHDAVPSVPVVDHQDLVGTEGVGLLHHRTLYQKRVDEHGAGTGELVKEKIVLGLCFGLMEYSSKKLNVAGKCCANHFQSDSFLLS